MINYPGLALQSSVFVVLCRETPTHREESGPLMYSVLISTTLYVRVWLSWLGQRRCVIARMIIM